MKKFKYIDYLIIFVFKLLLSWLGKVEENFELKISNINIFDYIIHTTT